MTDFVLYIHGVNVRRPSYARRMDRAIKRAFKNRVVTASIYWGDVSDDAEQKLLTEWKSSHIWKDMWFPDLREHMLLQLIGDGALYISRSFGAAVVKRIHDVVTTAVRGRRKGDRLHLVTHSWGAVMVLDMLFAARWLDGNVPGREDVQRLRDGLFGLGSNTGEGMLLTSITTMGSPMSLFSLMNGDIGMHDRSSHDIAMTMRQYCRELYNERRVPLAWFNFVHPGDAFAYPTAPLLAGMLKDDMETITAQDWLVRIDPLGRIVHHTIGKQNASAILAAAAHNGYWDNASVIKSVVQAIRSKA